MTCARAAAQDANGFSGPHVGGALATVDHHFVIELTNGTSTTRQNVTAWGLGGVLFAGYDLPVGKKLVAGIEGAFQFGGKTPSFTDGFGTRVAIKPLTGFSATARLGLVATPNFLLFAKGGYGEHRYTVTGPSNVMSGLDTTHSFVLGGGVEQKLRGKMALRAEFEHLDGTRNQFALGVVARF